MTETQEDWVQLAMGDACLVADLLLRLLRDPPPSSRSLLDWTVRGRRSQPQPRNSDVFTLKDATAAEPKVEQARASPSTPLSWSGATSTSGGASEESPSLLDNCHAARSKAPLASRFPTTTASAALNITAGKRPRQKKRSLFELKEEESLLLKEKKCLDQELASLRLLMEKERAMNESLKRLKANTAVVEQEKHTPKSCHQQRDAGYLDVTKQEPHSLSPCSGRNMVETFEKALLPDLNLPLEEQLS